MYACLWFTDVPGKITNSRNYRTTTELGMHAVYSLPSWEFQETEVRHY